MKKLILLSALLIFACSSDDHNEDISSSIIGKWYVIKYEYYEEGVLDSTENVKEIETNGCRSYFDIKSDYTLEFVTYFSDCSGMDGQTLGTWELINNSNTLQLNYNSGTFNWDIMTFDSNNLTIQIEDCDTIGCFKNINYYER